VSLDRLGDSIVVNEDSHVDAVRKGTGSQSAGNEGKDSKSSSSSNIASAADAHNQQDDAKAGSTKSISPPVATPSATSATSSSLEDVANNSGSISLRFDAEGIDERVEEIVNGWRSMPPMQPDVFLYKLLRSRGYDSAVIPAREYRE
jgi:hypothetical protein